LQPTNNPYRHLAPDIDLLTTACDLLLQLPADIEIKREWVKGHYSGPKRELKHRLNDIADELARDFNTSKRPLSALIAIFHPGCEAKLL
jgi:hypothetical protein